MEHLSVLRGSSIGCCRRAGRLGQGRLPTPPLWFHTSGCSGFSQEPAGSRMAYRAVPESTGKTCLYFQKGTFCSADVLWGRGGNYISMETNMDTFWSRMQSLRQSRRLQRRFALPPECCFSLNPPPPPPHTFFFCGNIWAVLDGRNVRPPGSPRTRYGGAWRRP